MNKLEYMPPGVGWSTICEVIKGGESRELDDDGICNICQFRNDNEIWSIWVDEDGIAYTIYDDSIHSGSGYPW